MTVVTADTNTLSLVTTDEIDTAVSAEHYLDVIQKWVQAEGVPVATSVHFGHAATEITKYAGSIHADLIVLSTHGRSGFQRFLLGSVAEQVVCKARCPVALIHDHERLAAYHKLLVPLDGTHRGEAILPVATDLARAYRATLLLLQVVPDIMETESDIRTLESGFDAGKYLEEAQSAASAYLDKVAQPLRTGGIEVETICAMSNPQATIVDTIRQQQPELILLATDTLAPLRRAILGSVADYILHHVDIPVVLYYYHGMGVERELVEAAEVASE